MQITLNVDSRLTLFCSKHGVLRFAVDVDEILESIGRLSKDEKRRLRRAQRWEEVPAQDVEMAILTYLTTGMASY